MNQTLGKRVLERVRRKKRHLEAEKARLHLDLDTAENRPEPALSLPKALEDFQQTDYQLGPNRRPKSLPEIDWTTFGDKNVREMYRRWRAGHFDGVALELHLGRAPDLAKVLLGYFAKKRLFAAEPDDLAKIAKTVLDAIPEPEAVA